MEKTKLADQIKLLAQVARCICLKKELARLESNPHLNFWRLIHGGLLDLAVLDWMKIFGSNVEPTHWKVMVQNHDDFRRSLLNYLDISEVEWSKYWHEMKVYRDEAVAHHFDKGNITHYPKLNIALKSCYFYYGYLIERFRYLGEVKYPDSLEEYCKRFSVQSNSIATLAVNATKGAEEAVW